MSVRAPRLPPRGTVWLSCTMIGTVEKSAGAFQSWSMSIGSSSAPAGSIELCRARGRAAAAGGVDRVLRGGGAPPGPLQVGFPPLGFVKQTREPQRRRREREGKQY